MKMKSFGLLALSVATLSMPLAANALTTAVTLNGDNIGSFVGGSLTVGSPLADGDSLYVTVNKATSGTYTYNSLFTLAKDSQISGNATFIKPVNASVKLTVGLGGPEVTGAWDADNGQWLYSGLKAGTTYDWVSAGTIAAGKTGTFSSQLTVAAVPEPEEWAMMLVGAGLVSYQVRRKQKRLRKSALA